NTRLFFLETPSNPLTEVSDVRKLAKVAKQAGALLAVDNVFCTPILQRPLELGADLGVHSATKYLDGQGRGMGRAGLRSEEDGGRDLRLEEAGGRADDRVPAHRRAGAVAVQRLGAAEGPRDAADPHARPVGGRARARAVAGSAPEGGERALPRPRLAPAAR